MKLEQMMDSVEVKNRVVDGPVKITFDGTMVEWAPGEVKRLPRKLAEWFQAKSLYSFHPGDINEGIPAKSHYKLVMLGCSQDEGDLSKLAVNEVKELLDASNMPELTRIDPTTGQPLRRVYIDPRSTGARDKYVAKELQATKSVSSAIVREAAEQIADAAQGASEQEIEAAVADMTGVNKMDVV